MSLRKLVKNMTVSIIFLAVAVSAVAQVKVTKQVELTYTVPKGSSDYTTYLNFIPLFEEIYPWIKVNYEGRPRERYLEGLLMEFATGDTDVDIMHEWPSQETFPEQGHVIPLDGSYDPEIKIDLGLLTKIFPSMVELWTYPRKPIFGMKPRLYGMPLNNSDAMLIVYREDLVKEAGFDGPPKTWQERTELGKKMTKDLDGDGQIDIWGDAFPATRAGMMGQQTVWCFLNSLWLDGGRYVDDNFMPAFDTKEGIEALGYMVNRVGQSVSPSVTTYGSAEILDLMNAGKLAMGDSNFGYYAWMDIPARPQYGKVFIAPIPPKEG